MIRRRHHEHLVLLTSALVLAAGACTGHISAGYDTDAEADADADIDADIDADSDSDGDADSDSDADEDDEIEIDPLISNVIGAINRNQALLCHCFYADNGYASEADCTTATESPPEVTFCTQMGYETDEDELEPFYQCRYVLEDGLGDCLDESGCELAEMELCGDAYFDGIESCPEVSAEADQAFDDAFFRCMSGEPSGCPDATLTPDAVRFAGDTRDQGNDLESAECGGEGAADISIRWTPAATGAHRLEVVEADFDPMLYVLESCEGAELACNDDIDRAGGNWLSRVELELTAGVPIIIVIDGWAAWEQGAFQIEITAL